MGDPLTSEASKPTPQTEAKTHAEVKPLDQGVQEVKRVLGTTANELLPEGKDVVEVDREDFSSATMGITDRGDMADGHLYGIRFSDGSEAYFVNQRISKTPWDNPIAFGGVGLDLREETNTVMAQWDGKNTITATNLLTNEVSVVTSEVGRTTMTTTHPDGKITTQTYSGEFGTPNAMLPSWRKALLGQSGEFGKSLGVQKFANSPQAS